MQFAAPIFLIFVSAFFLVHVALGDWQRGRLWLIAIGSLAFYATWNLECLPLLVGTAMLDFWCAVLIERDRSKGGSGTRWLVLSMALNLSVLAYFKYMNFFLDSISEASTWFGFSFHVPFEVLLPIGISFYTFQSMSYTIDVYRESVAARRDPLVFVAAVTFFPHLIAGPIVRGAHLVPQFERGPIVTPRRLQTGLLLIGAGLFKKTIADMVAAIADGFYAPHVWGNAANAHEWQNAAADGLLGAWAGVIAFAAQIYCDFAGYTDIAIGLALVFGFDFPQNFNLPYLAKDPADFWNRWHMSLSTWLRDYLFFPLARRFEGSLFLPIILTMLLAGIWHGAGAHFAAYGLYLGLLIYGTHLVRRRLRSRVDTRTGRLITTVFTFYAIPIVGFCLFRAQSVREAGQVIVELHTAPWLDPTWETIVDFALAVIALVVGHGCDWLLLRKRPLLLRLPMYIPLVLFFTLFTISFGAAHMFIYFKF
jgi:alginate O-acetyltransferase complex protein AlgI